MDDQKTIDELIALYFLEPTLKDIYVEGTADKGLIEWVLSGNGIEDVSVYPISIVNVNEDYLKRHCVDKGSNRSRVLALSAELATSLKKTAKVVCIVDRDYEDYLPSGINNCFLEFTDYNSTELYLYNPMVINKFIHLVLGGFHLSVDDIMIKALPVLEYLYVVRLANRALEWRMSWIDFTKYIHVSNDIQFNRDGFLKAYLLKNKKWSKRSTFEKKVREFLANLKPDHRFRVRGHDLMEFMHYTVKKLKKKRKFGNVWTLQGALTGCLELQKLSEKKLFQRLLSL
ncbi:MAG: hypothetical protein KAW47_01340 [Thermoplasmatales archaeon]|nr:hypothetical protein [Thermoplasmatales archaeon]